MLHSALLSSKTMGIGIKQLQWLLHEKIKRVQKKSVNKKGMYSQRKE